MAFDGYPSTFAKSFFPTYKRQASVNMAGENNGSVASPFVAIPSVSLQEQNTASYIPWSHNDHDDPHSLIKCAQNGIKSRKPTDGINFDRDTDLQGLVSNILDEVVPQESYYSDGLLPTCNPIWSPNYVSRETYSKAQGQSVDRDFEEVYQQSNGLFKNQERTFSLPNGDWDGYTIHSQKPPPCLPMPNTGNIYLSQVLQGKYDNMPADKDKGYIHPINTLPDLSNVFSPQIEMNSKCFNPYYEEEFIQSSNEQWGPQDINQLVSSFQSLMAGEHDNMCSGDFLNIHRQAMGARHEDATVEQWKNISPAVPTQSAPAMQTPKQLLGDFGTLQMERNGGVRKQTFNRDAFHDLPGLSPQSTEYFQPPKPFPALLNLPKQYQSNMTLLHRENTSFPNNTSVDQYSKNHIQQRLIESKPQMQRKKKRIHMSGFLGEGFSTRPLTNTNMIGRDKKQTLSQNSNFDHLGSMHSQRFDGENGMVSAGNTQQCMPFMYPVNDPRRYSINSSNFSRSPLNYGSGVPGMNFGDMTSANVKGKSTYHGMGSAMTASVAMNQRGPVLQLYVYLEECYDQWRSLEKERKETEFVLAKTFLGTPAAYNTNLPKTPPNPTRVDHLIVKQMREQARVASLLDRMECVCNTPLHINIHAALNQHHLAICITQARRKEEIAKPQWHHFKEDRDTLSVAMALKDLAVSTRKVRTVLWCALQMTLPKTYQEAGAPC